MMDEIWLRVGLIAGALVIAAVITLFLRSRFTETKRSLVETGLQPGVYFFSSSGCSDCLLARQTLSDALGEEGFLEIAWEGDRDIFDRLGVDAVPATMIVAADGSGTLWPGRAKPALDSLGP